MHSNECRDRAFERFKKVARAEQANGAESLSIFRLVYQFSTAPKEETAEIMVIMRYWSRNGDGEALVKFGTELCNWAQDNGYHP